MNLNYVNLVANVNSYCWVQLTEHGRAEHKRKQIELGLPEENYLRPHEIHGWSQWQIWVLMSYFGHMMNSEGLKAPFGAEIHFTNPNL